MPFPASSPADRERRRPPATQPGGLPPGWPDGVRPPGTPGWVRSATSWLLDQCPPDHRGYPLLQRHPTALAWLADRHVAAAADAVAVALGAVRSELAGALPPQAVEELVVVLEREQARLRAARRGAALLRTVLVEEPGVST